MTTGIAMRSEAPGTAHADLGFWMQSQIIGQPMAITEQHLNVMIEMITANRFTLPRNRSTAARITEKGTAIVEVHGVLINRAPVLGSFWGLTAYEGLTEQFRRLATNDDVKRIVLDIDSPGGLVAGIRGCSEALEKLAEKKPVHALAHDMACSAGYWLACIAQELSVAPDGEVGSIGVRGGHVSYAEMLERAGIQVTNFSVGAAKLDGAMAKLLTPGEAAEKQYDLERAYDRFVAHVVKHRPLTDTQVRDTDARTFVGQDAISRGLADRVETLEDMIERLEKSAAKVKPKRKQKTDLSSKGGVMPSERNPAEPDSDDEPTMGIPTNTGERLMSEQNNAAGQNLVDAITQALASRSVAVTAAPAAPVATTPAAEADSDRIFAILESPEAKASPSLARTLAKSGMSSADAIAALKAAAQDAPAPAAPAAVAEPTGDKAALDSALAVEMRKPGNAAGVKPDAANAGKPRSFGEFANSKAKASRA